jgi:hypothetical protein
MATYGSGKRFDPKKIKRDAHQKNVTSLNLKILFFVNDLGGRAGFPLYVGRDKRRDARSF